MVKEEQASGAAPVVSGPPVLKVLEDLLVTLRRSSKDLVFYPPEHPMLKRSLDRAVSQLQAALGARAPLVIAVSRASFTYDGQAIGQENQQLAGMAAELFVRRIQQFLFARDIERDELAAFLRMITSDPKLLVQQGGPTKVLADHGVQRIQVNESDFRRLGGGKGPGDRTAGSGEKGQSADGGRAGTAKSGAPGEKAREVARTSGAASTPQGTTLLGAGAPGPALASSGAADLDRAAGQPGHASTATPKTPESGTGLSVPALQREQTVAALIQRLEQEAVSGKPAAYEWAASQLETAARRAIRDEKLADVLAIIRVFLRHQQAADFKTPVRERAAQAVRSVTADDTVPYLVRHLGVEAGASLEDLSAILAGLGPGVIPHLLDFLVTEDQGGGRHPCVSILGDLLGVAQPEVVRALQQADGEQARHLALTLSEIGSEGCVGLLACLVRHRDARVRLDAVRGLGRIGGASTHRPLLQAARDPDPGVLEMAVRLVGVGRVKLAAPILLRLAGERVLAGKRFAVRKAAVAALGAMGDPGSVSRLTGLLRTRTWFRRAAGRELRLAAAQALLEMGHPEAREVVEAGADARRADVRRACATALRRSKESTPVTE